MTDVRVGFQIHCLGEGRWGTVLRPFSFADFFGALLYGWRHHSDVLVAEEIGRLRCPSEGVWAWLRCRCEKSPVRSGFGVTVTFPGVPELGEKWCCSFYSS